MAILEVQNLTKRFIGLVAVNDVSFSVEQGSTYGIVGPNGAGKTTIFNMIAGALPITSGTVIFEDNKIGGLQPNQLASKGISRTFQNVRLFENMTVAENILVGGLHTYKTGIYQGLLGTGASRRDKKILEDRVVEMLEFFELTPYASNMADGLAYGHRRRLEMARALVSKPKLLLLDEPTAGMNSTEKAEVVELLEKIKKTGVTTIVIEHDMKFIKGICDNIMVLDYGEKLSEGDPEVVLKNPEVIKAYLGGEKYAGKDA